MSRQEETQGSRFGRRRFGPVEKQTFYSRHFRTIHIVTTVLGVAAFFGPFVYRYINRPPLEEVQFIKGQPRPDYKRLQAELDNKWR